MVKNILLKRALLLSLFVQGVFLFSGLLSAAGVDYAAGLREAFAGRTSFFAISVSRTTERNVESDYPPLTSTERFFVRSVLDMFLNAGHPDGMFQVQLEAASRQDAKQYQFLETKFAEIKASISDQIAIQDLQKQWLDLFPAEQRNNVWQALGRESALDPKAFKMDSFTAHQQRALTHTLQKMRTLGQKIDKEKDKISMKEFSKVEKKILEYGRIQQHENLRMQCCALWKKLLIQMRGQMEFLAGIGFSRSSYCLVVFNEMFFGKNTPFPSGVLQREIDQLSSRHPNKIFHVNFLNSAIVKPESCAAFLNTYKGRNALFDWEQVGDYDRYFQSLPQYNDLVPVLENISETFFQGNQLTYYRKSTYQTESDEDLQKEIFYMFGNGRDANALHGEASAVLMDSLATEICYDLHLGIRKQMASYPANLKILVVPSNTLPFNDENMRNLPAPNQTKAIFHVDPKEQVIFVKTPIITQELSAKFSYYAEPIWQKERPLFVLQFELENSLYQIKFWEISRFLR